jgi:hypothetical protein
VSTPDAVSKFYIQKAKMTYLNYVLFLEEFGEDLKKYCPKIFVRNSLIGIYFSKLAGKYKEALKLCFNSIKAYPKLFLISLSWTIFCLITPKFLIIKIYEDFFKKFKESFKKVLAK